ncbi:MAG TPA: PPK2 family polyphosphate kinase [Solirubrobacteraceae bacterium]|jgi:PPK2 family polyphosphate:nucleotide phosphotransferase|nr:PPK2 family polyphosphate kinase [Solirubrobacteraceae bacterium]
MGERRRERILRVGEQLRVRPGATVSLANDFDPGDTGEVSGKKQGKKLLGTAVKVISDYQRLLAAEERRGVLLVLQALDAGGKDGTIRHVLSGVNPAGVAVQSFKQPSEEELAHDFLWRYEQHLPAPGQIAVFNRSHYEEVLVVRVHPEHLEAQQISPAPDDGDVWQRRFREINEWERDLVDRGVRIVKLLLNISNEEQRVRFLRRCDLPEKHWKFSASDIKEREHWDEYQYAFSEMLTHTSTEWAPWHVLPADHKWFARLAAASVLMGALMRIDPQIPEVDPEARKGLAAAREELEAQAPRDEPADPVAEDPDEYR